MLLLGHSASYTCQAISQTACVCVLMQRKVTSLIEHADISYFRFTVVK